MVECPACKHLPKSWKQEQPGSTLASIIIVLNEADFIFQVLQSIYSSVGKIVIVEGATKYAVKDVVSPDGLSTDGTAQLIQAFKDTLDVKDKIKWVRAGWVVNKTDLWNRCLEHLPEQGVEFVLMLGGDELFMEEELKSAVQSMRDSNALVAQARHLMFWGSTERLLECVPDPDYVSRIYRYSPSMFFKDHNNLYMDAGHYYHEDPNRVIRPDGFHLYHYGWARDKRKILLKRWERLRQLQEEGRDIPHLRYLQAKDDYGLYLEAISHCKSFNLANIDAKHESIMPYHGPHPWPMLSHPFWKKESSFFGVD